MAKPLKPRQPPPPRPPNKPSTSDVKLTIRLPWTMYDLVVKTKEAMRLGSISEATRFLIAMATLLIESGLAQFYAEEFPNALKRVNKKKKEEVKPVKEIDKVYVVPVHRIS